MTRSKKKKKKKKWSLFIERSETPFSHISEYSSRIEVFENADNVKSKFFNYKTMYAAVYIYL